MADGPDVEAFLDDLRSNGRRITSARRLVLEELLTDGAEHLTAETLAERIHRRQRDTHLSTIYRTLDLLEAEGLVTQIRLSSGPAGYHLAHDAHHHHAICDHCGACIDLPDDTFDSMVARLGTEFGFEARPTHLTIDGTCKTCRTDP